MANIQDIAKATGYSATTVSKAFNNYTDINETTKKKILEMAKKLDYIPNAQARGLKMKRSFTVGVILDELHDLGLSHPFFSLVVQSFRKYIEASGYSIILIANELGNTRIESYIAHCNQLNVDAIFVLCSDAEDQGIKDLIHSNIPTVLFDMPDKDTSSVITNHYQGAFDAVKYLVDKGHTSIAHIYGSELTYAGAERQRGYLDAMHAFNLNVPDAYMVSGGYFDLKYGKLAMETLLALKNRPTAVFASGDMMALGAIQACYEHDVVVPDDISVIGFDNLMLLDWIHPALTTVAQDYTTIGRVVAEMLTEMVGKKETKHQSRIIDTRIVERASCIDYKQ